MRCRHCGEPIAYDYAGREWAHRNTGKVECIIDGADVGTVADPKDKDTWEDDE